MQRSIAIRLLIFSSLCSVPLAGGKVWTVMSPVGPGIDFATVGAAMQVAGDGDVILLRGLTADWLMDIGGKGVTVLTDVGVTSNFWMVKVHDVPAGRTCTVRGVITSGVELSNCAGAVVLEEITVQSSLIAPTGTPALRVDGCAGVVVRGGSFRGSKGLSSSDPGDAGLLASNSNVSVWNAELAGGPGAGDPLTASKGGPGAQVVGGDLWLIGTPCKGGAGGPSGSVFCGCCHPGLAAR